MAESGQRAVLFFAVLHSGITRVAPAWHIDPRYAEMLLQAQRRGVEVLCYGAQLSPDGIRLQAPIPFFNFDGDLSRENSKRSGISLA